MATQVIHGTEQAARGRAAIIECAQEKQEKGRLVKQESQDFSKQIAQHKQHALEEMRSNVRAWPATHLRQPACV